MKHPAVVVQFSGTGSTADGEALHDSQDRVVGVVVNLLHIHIWTDGAVCKPLSDGLGHGAVGGFKGLGGLVLDLVEPSCIVQGKLCIKGKAHPFGVQPVEPGIADKNLCRILQAGCADSGLSS